MTREKVSARKIHKVVATTTWPKAESIRSSCAVEFQECGCCGKRFRVGTIRVVMFREIIVAYTTYRHLAMALSCQKMARSTLTHVRDEQVVKVQVPVNCHQSLRRATLIEQVAHQNPPPPKVNVYPHLQPFRATNEGRARRACGQVVSHILGRVMSAFSR